MADISSSSSTDLATSSSQETSLTTLSAPEWSKSFEKTPNPDRLTREERFRRWRPSYHFQAANGWMNDPCAPGFNPTTGLYHLSYQWNPHGVDWGDISWGSATSTDLITWKLKDSPSLIPDQPYDKRGVFSGCLINGRDGSLTQAYTSVSHLPIHHTFRHVRGSESLSLAKSFDEGKTWRKIDKNPILPCEPKGIEVTGWRDPFVASWPKLAKYLHLDPDSTLFGIISGGIRDVSPTTFLYAVDAEHLESWKYLGPLINFGLNFRPSRWSVDLGRNWEVSNFMTLKDENDQSVERDFIVMGAEGCLPTRAASIAGSLGPARPARGQLWMSGKLQTPKPLAHSGPTEMTYEFGGHIDHGCLYAANSFFDPKSQKRIMWGWITEEDLCDDLRHAQGWSGMLSMPRELRLQTLHNVVSASSCDLSSITSIELEQDSHGTYTLRTLASQPYQPLIEKLRQHPNVRKSTISNKELTSGIYNVSFPASAFQTNQWELEAIISVSKRSAAVGLSIDHSGDYTRCTTLFYDVTTETFIINRPAFPILSSSELINSAPETAPHTLFTTRDPETGESATEKLHIRAWRDNSVLEVFINGRTAISTRIYAAEETFGMRFFADDCPKAVADVPCEVVEARIWDGIGIE